MPFVQNESASERQRSAASHTTSAEIQDEECKSKRQGTGYCLRFTMGCGKLRSSVKEWKVTRGSEAIMAHTAHVLASVLINKKRFQRIWLEGGFMIPSVVAFMYSAFACVASNRITMLKVLIRYQLPTSSK